MAQAGSRVLAAQTNDSLPRKGQTKFGLQLLQVRALFYPLRFCDRGRGKGFSAFQAIPDSIFIRHSSSPWIFYFYRSSVVFFGYTSRMAIGNGKAESPGLTAKLIELSSLHRSWLKQTPRSVAQELVRVLSQSLGFDPVYVALRHGASDPVIEIAAPGDLPVRDWIARARKIVAQPQRAKAAGSRVVQDSRGTSRPLAIVPIGADSHWGVIATGSKRQEFPSDHDLLLLNVCAQQAALALPHLQNALGRGNGVGAPPSAYGSGERNRRSEEMQKACSQLFPNVVKNTAMIMLDPEGRVIDWNAGAERIYGYTHDEIHLRSASCLFPADSPPHKLKVELERAAAGQRVEEEGWRRRKDGALFYAGVSLDALRDSQGALRGFAAVTRDVTERRLTQAALRQSDQTFRRIFEEGPVGMALIGANRRFQKTNVALARLLGYSRAQLKKLSLLDVTYRPDIQLDHESARRLQRGELKGFTVEKRLVTRTRQIVWARIVTSLIRDEEGKLIYQLAIIEDFTLRKRAEEKVRFQASLLDQVCNAVIATDLAGRVSFWNAHAETLYQWKAREVMGKPLTEILIPKSQLARARKVISYVEKTGCWSGEFTVRRKDGSLFEAYVLDAVIKGESGEPDGIVGVSFDITEQKRSEDQLRKSQQQLRALTAHLHWVREKERTHISREIHDELGQALTGFKIDLAWLDQRIKELNGIPSGRRLRDKIESMSGLVDSTIKQVRKITTELRPRILDELGLVPALEWQAREFQTRTGLHCRFVAEADRIAMDDDQATAVFRIFQETLTNVLRHAGATRVDVTLCRRDDGLTLEVRDNGKGISQKQLADTRAMGLLGMRERALLSRGRLTIRGERTKGTTISLWIPLSGPKMGEASGGYPAEDGPPLRKKRL